MNLLMFMFAFIMIAFICSFIIFWPIWLGVLFSFGMISIVIIQCIWIGLLMYCLGRE
jgi:hypothetical protein